MRAVATAAALALGGSCQCSGSADAPTESCLLVPEGSGPVGTVSVRAETVVDGLEVPWGLAFIGPGDFLVTERAGRIRRFSAGALSAPLATLTVAGGEGGLLGIALHPAFAQNQLFYIYVTVDDGGRHNRVERWRLDGPTASRDRIVLDGIPGANFHDGGRLRFGPDGMLYVGTGDAGEPSNAQDRQNPSGKILRLDPEGAAPGDNPFAPSPVFLLGLRNTQGFDWRDAGTLAVTDHGPSGELGRRGHDEVNGAVAAGENLGWPEIFGCEEASGMVSPSLTWTEAVPPGGAAFYTGEAIPEWKGSLLVGSLGARHLHRVAFDAAAPRRVTLHEVYFPGTFGRLREVIMGPDGELYVTTSNCDGRGTCPPAKDQVLRITR